MLFYFMDIWVWWKNSFDIHCVELKIRDVFQFDYGAVEKMSFSFKFQSPLVIKWVWYILETMGDFMFILYFFGIVRFIVINIALVYFCPSNQNYQLV